MTSELILMADVEGLGPAGTVVKVADGYARNNLIPRKLAAPISRAAMRQFEKQRMEKEALLKEELETARSLAKTIEQMSCTIPVKVGESGKLFGSVTTGDVEEALSKQNIKIDKHKIHLDESIREIGIYTAMVKLHAEVDASLKIWVVEE